MTRRERRNFVYNTIINFIYEYKEKNISEFLNDNINIMIKKDLTVLQ